jgi:hypothetical protein
MIAHDGPCLHDTIQLSEINSVRNLPLWDLGHSTARVLGHNMCSTREADEGILARPASVSLLSEAFQRNPVRQMLRAWNRTSTHGAVNDTHSFFGDRGLQQFNLTWAAVPVSLELHVVSWDHVFRPHQVIVLKRLAWTFVSPASHCHVVDKVGFLVGHLFKSKPAPPRSWLVYVRRRTEP